MDHKQYQFRSHWLIEASIDDTWDVICLPQLWHTWWPDLRTMHILEQPKILEGTLLVGVLRGLIGYPLQVVFDVEKVQDKQEILIRISGDLSGYLLVQLVAKSKIKTIVKFTWDVKTTKRWMNKMPAALGKLFTKNHYLIMQRGEKGLNKYIQKHKVQPDE